MVILPDPTTQHVCPSWYYQLVGRFLKCKPVLGSEGRTGGACAHEGNVAGAVSADRHSVLPEYLAVPQLLLGTLAPDGAHGVHHAGRPRQRGGAALDYFCACHEAELPACHLRASAA